MLGSAGDILQAFSVFTVLVFLFLVRYANRFLLRRRKREFALYELCGMGRGAVSVLLVAETALVGAGALACGLAAGAALSPAFGAVAAFVSDAPWRLALSFSPDSAALQGPLYRYSDLNDLTDLTSRMGALLLSEVENEDEYAFVRAVPAYRSFVEKWKAVGSV